MGDQPKEQSNEAPVTVTQDVIKKTTELIYETFCTDSLVEQSLDIPNNSIKELGELGEQEKEVLDKLIIAAEKFRELRYNATDLLSSLTDIIELTLGGLRCGVDDDIVFDQFAKSLDEEIMTEKLREVCDGNQAAETALLNVQTSLKKLTKWCGMKIAKLPAQEACMVRKLTMSGVAPMIRGVAALLNLLKDFHPALKIGAALTVVGLKAAQLGSGVIAIRKVFKGLIEYLQSAEQYWGQVHGKVKSLHEDLEKLSVHWRSLKKNTLLSSGYCAYFLGTPVEKSVTNVPPKIFVIPKVTLGLGLALALGLWLGSKLGFCLVLIIWSMMLLIRGSWGRTTRIPNAKVRENLKAEFVKALEDMNETCNAAINVMNRPGIYSSENAPSTSKARLAIAQ